MLRLKQDIRRLTLIPSGGGKFEVTINGQKIYSKLDTGEFPDPASILKTLRQHS